MTWLRVVGLGEAKSWPRRGEHSGRGHDHAGKRSARQCKHSQRQRLRAGLVRGGGRRVSLEPLASFDLARLIEVGVPGPNLMCGGLLYRRGLHTLTGPPDCGKTSLALRWALDLLDAGTSVVWLDEESGPEIAAEKLIAFGVKPADLADLHYYPFPSRPWSPGDVAMLGEVMKTCRPVLTIWDSAAAFLARAGLSEDDAGEVTGFWSNVLAPCARLYGSAVLVIDHDTKNGGQSRYARGSGAKLAATDVAYKLEAVRQFSRSQDGELRLTVTKDRRGSLPRAHRIRVARSPLTFAFAEDAVPPDLASPQPAGKPTAKDLVFSVLTDTPEPVAKIAGLVNAKCGHALRRPTISGALNSLANDGLADCVDPGTGRQKLWFLRVR